MAADGSYYRGHGPADYPQGRGTGQHVYVNQPLDPPERPSLKKTISTSNLEQNTKYSKSAILGDFVMQPPLGGTNYLATTPAFTLTIPPLDNTVPGFKQFVIDKLVDKATQGYLEQDNVLNWCKDTTKLVPLKTVSDGNCLLHAASLGMWGFQDRNLDLRRALSEALRYDNGNTLYQRWEYSRELENRKFQIELEPYQWEEEWKAMLKQTSTEVEIGRNLDSLDEFHVFVLANVLRRPIIMYASPKHRSLQGEGTLQEVNFHGVYLPLLWEHTTCKKSPLPLAYSGGHFTALVAGSQSHQDQPFILPLVDYHGKELPLKFALSMEDPVGLFMDYLSPRQITCHSLPHTSKQILCAELVVVEPPEHLKVLISGFIEACWAVFGRGAEGGPYRREEVRVPDDRAGGGGGPPFGRDDRAGGGGGPPFGREDRAGGGGNSPRGKEAAEKIKCVNACGMYGDPEHAYLCSNCYRKTMEETNKHSPPRQSPRAQLEPNREDRFGAEGGASLGTVKCPQCSEPGYAQLLGMCKRCYDNNTSLQQAKDPIYESLPGEHGLPEVDHQLPPAIPPPRKSKERRYCRNPSCNFYGSEENKYYCSQCFNNNMEAILNEVDDQLPLSPSRPGISFPVPGQAPKGCSSSNAGEDDHDPPLCYSCKQFFSSEEYAGLCNGCFMKSTVSGGPAPRRNRISTEPHSQKYGDGRSAHQNPAAPVNPNRATRPDEYHGYQNLTAPQGVNPDRPPFPPTGPNERRGYHDPTAAPQGVNPNMAPFPPTRPDERHGYHNPTAPQAVNPNRAPFPSDDLAPHRSSRTPNATAPIANLTSQMADMSVSPDCFICNGGRLGESQLYTICAKHAAAAMMGRGQGDQASDGRERVGGEVRSKPPPALGRDHYDAAYQHSSVNPGYQRQKQGAAHDWNRAEARRSPVSYHQGYRGDSGGDQVYEKRGPRQQFGNEESYHPPPPPPPQERFGNEQDFSHHEPRQFGNGQGYPLQPQQGRVDLEQKQAHPPPHREFGNEQGYPPQELERFGNKQPNQRGDFSPRRFGNEQGYPRQEQHRFGNEQEYPPQHDPQYVGRPHSPPHEGRGGAVGGAAGGGAVGGDPLAGGMDDDPPPIMKALCAAVGCSFKGYKDLDGLCPDCYKDEHKNEEVSAERYPLV